MRAFDRKILPAGAVIALATALVVGLAGPSFGGSAAKASARAKVSAKADGANLVKLGKVLQNPADWQTKWANWNAIKLLATYDDSGPAAWDPAQHPTVFVTSMGIGYGGFSSTNTHPGLVIIDAATRKVVTYRTYDLGLKTYNESHGLGVSPDGKWIYIPTGDVDQNTQGGAGRTIVVNAKTLRVRQVIQTWGMPHHFKAFTRSDGKQLVMGEDFSWRTKSSVTQSGSGVYVLDPADNNKVVGAVNVTQLQARPYLAFASPNGKYFYIGLSATRDPGRTLEADGSWAVVNTQTYEPIKYFAGGEDPVWTAFSPDGKLAYLCDAGSDRVYQIDAVALKALKTSRSSVHGAYGCHLGWNPSELWMVEKGEASHNRGKNIGLVDAQLMQPVDNYNTGWIRADHGTVNPNQKANELWVTANSTFEVAVWNMGSKKITARIRTPLGASTHSGAFVTYKPDFTGQVVSDQNGLHGAALAAQKAIWDKANAPKPAPQSGTPQG